MWLLFLATAFDLWVSKALQAMEQWTLETAAESFQELGFELKGCWCWDRDVRSLQRLAALRDS